MRKRGILVALLVLLTAGIVWAADTATGQAAGKTFWVVLLDFFFKSSLGQVLITSIIGALLAKRKWAADTLDCVVKAFSWVEDECKTNKWNSKRKLAEFGIKWAEMMHGKGWKFVPKWAIEVAKLTVPLINQNKKAELGN